MESTAMEEIAEKLEKMELPDPPLRTEEAIRPFYTVKMLVHPGAYEIRIITSSTYD